MATVHNQAVPASLVDPLADIFGMVQSYPSTVRTTTARAHYPGANDYKPSSPLGRLALFTGTWFRDKWQGTVPLTDLANFYAARKNDIYTGTFPANYWTRINPTWDKTQRCSPSEVLPYDKPVNPAYYDETRKPSYCYMDTIGATYNTPSGNGTPEQPAPGWHGEVIGELWRDVWLADRALAYDLPQNVYKTDKRPLVLKIVSEIEASASDRGVESWFITQTIPTFTQQSPTQSVPPGNIIAAWSRDFVRPVTIPPADPFGWDHTVTTTEIRDAWANCRYDGTYARWRVWLVIGSPPSRGLYFGRNATVQVWSRFNVEFYFARDPHA